MNDKLSAEERDILDRFERGDVRSAAGAEREIEVARQAARNTFNKTKRVNLRVNRARLQSRSLAGPGKKGYPIKHCCPALSTNTSPAD